MDDVYILHIPGHEGSLFWKAVLCLKPFVLNNVKESSEAKRLEKSKLTPRVWVWSAVSHVATTWAQHLFHIELEGQWAKDLPQRQADSCGGGGHLVSCICLGAGPDPFEHEFPKQNVVMVKKNKH